MVIDAPQRSPEWFAARAGRLTGSAAKAMLSQIKAGEAAARRDLRMKLVVERLTGAPQEDGFVNDAMQWGIDKEADAFAAYEALTGHMAERTGFVAHTELMAGCSLDGHIGSLTEGLLELKCPKSTTHFGYLQARQVPSEHKAQLTHNLWITGAKWIDFLSFDPRFPPDLQTFYMRLLREDVDIAAYELAARLFLSEVDKELETARALAAGAVAA